MNQTKQTVTAASDGETLVSVYIPSEGTGAYLEGALNGVNFRVPTDKVVEIPSRIARVIAESRREMREGKRALEAFSEVGGRRIG